MQQSSAPIAVDQPPPAPPQLALLAQLACDLTPGIDAGLSVALARLVGHFGALGGALYEPARDGVTLARRTHVGPIELPLRPPEETPDSLHIPINAMDRQLGLLVLAQARRSAADAPLLEALAGHLAWAIEARNLSARLHNDSGLRQELEVAAELQRSLLPKPIPGAPVFGLNRPVYEVSGDFFDFFTLPSGRIPFALGDVSGKGIKSAMLMAKAASLFRCLAKTIGDPTELLRRINEEICETASRGMFVTMVAGVYESSTGLMRLANAGHEPPMVRYPDRSYRTFPADVPPLGILPDLRPKTVEVALGGGEFYVFSDGLTEFRYSKGEDLGVEGLVQLLESMPEKTQHDRLVTLLAELDGAGWEARDDLTVLAIDDSPTGGQS